MEVLESVLPGDKISKKGRFSLGIHNSRAYLAGNLIHLSPSKYFISSKTNRYSPSIDDLVIGKIIYTSPEYYKLDLGGCVGYLPSLSFPNATKRNRPELKHGDWVFCRVVRVCAEPLLTCIGKGLGPLVGDVFPIPCWKIRSFYLTDYLNKIGKNYKFMIALGLNGWVWISSESALTVREVYNLIK
ncbi:putative exosome complex component rrp40 [Astathelohania contejeani]|uniref:Exosome complex component rrp40 n=1 Tax=Astathelohania contejeani TaxID=164912 RepID=A0ABQ7I1N6_9MICR|nr:putative exosome complex component rrp40 [Thelohania contejeani]